MLNENTCWIVGNVLFKTINGGQTWIDLSWYDGLNDVTFINSNKGWAVGWERTILGTTDAGQTWNSQYNGQGWEPPFYGICFIDTDHGTVVGDGEIFQTTNGGETWNSQTFDTTGRLHGVAFVNANNGTVIGDNGMILKTTDSGENWITQLSGTINDLWGVSFIDTDNGFVAGVNGTILKTTNGGVTFAEEENFSQPKELYLEQNYPNPFNPTTTIKYYVPVGSFVILKVYDVLGREISTIVNAEKPEGTYEVNFSATGGANGLTSGIYFYKLQAGDFIQTRKMILLK